MPSPLNRRLFKGKGLRAKSEELSEEKELFTLGTSPLALRPNLRNLWNLRMGELQTLLRRLNCFLVDVGTVLELKNHCGLHGISVSIHADYTGDAGKVFGGRQRVTKF